MTTIFKRVPFSIYHETNILKWVPRTPESPEWSCGASLLGRAWCFRLKFTHWRNQLVARLSDRSDIGVACCCSALRATTWRNARMPSQLAAIPSFALCAVAPFVDLVLSLSFSLYSSDWLSSLRPTPLWSSPPPTCWSSQRRSSVALPLRFLCWWLLSLSKIPGGGQSYFLLIREAS